MTIGIEQNILLIMSIVTYHAGSKEFSFNSRIHLKDVPLLAVEENLNEEVKLDLKKRGITDPKVHDISICDDNETASIESFSKIGSLKIIKTKE